MQIISHGNGGEYQWDKIEDIRRVVQNTIDAANIKVSFQKCKRFLIIFSFGVL